MPSEQKKESKEAYIKHDADNMNIRDFMAFDRTRLANERTLLAWFRTSIAIFITGGTLFKLYNDQQVYMVIGIGLVVTAIVVAITGIISFRKFKKRLLKIYSDEENRKH